MLFFKYYKPKTVNSSYCFFKLRFLFQIFKNFFYRNNNNNVIKKEAKNNSNVSKKRHTTKFFNLKLTLMNTWEINRINRINRIICP